MDGLALFRQAMQEDTRQAYGSDASSPIVLRQSSFETRAKFLWCKASYREHRRRVLEADPFEDLMWQAEVERALEHCYDIDTKRWVQREILIRADLDRIVGSGAMRQCFQTKILHQDIKQHDWQRLREKPMQAVVPGIGAKTSRWLGVALLGPGAQDLRIGECLDLMHKEVHVVRTELARIVHDGGKRERAVAMMDRLFEKDREMKLAWRKFARNVMTKDYKPDKMDPAGKLAAFKADVVMQEFCKDLSQAYNLFDPPPPKPIDMLHVGMVELIDRQERPMLAFECFIQGKYKKWNTNAGWLDSRSRHTPQAFSFFTYRYTNGEYIVVDIQGVGNIYTDPQVHCSKEDNAPKCASDGSETDEEEEEVHQFGEGNLGTRGMALFVGTFRYDLNPIVQYMGLAPFAWAPNEKLPADPDEIAHFESGMEYLQSKEWDVRRKTFKRSNSTGTDIEHLEQRVAWFLCEAAEKYQLFDVVDVDQIPDETSIESKVHLDLAGFHRENDERIVAERGCSSDDAYWFHVWMSALGGNVTGQVTVAEHLSDIGRENDALVWYSLASSRSRKACLRAAKLLEARPEESTEDRLRFYSTALEIPDGFASDAERLALMETCDHEIHEKLARLYATIYQRSETDHALDTAVSHLKRAADIVLEIGRFKCHTKYQMMLEQVRGGDISAIA